MTAATWRAGLIVACLALVPACTDDDPFEASEQRPILDDDDGGGASVAEPEAEVPNSAQSSGSANDEPDTDLSAGGPEEGDGGDVSGGVTPAEGDAGDEPTGTGTAPSPDEVGSDGSGDGETAEVTPGAAPVEQADPGSGGEADAVATGTNCAADDADNPCLPSTE